MAPSYPVATLNNGLLDVCVYLPDAVTGYYRAGRFAWAGIVAQVRCGGHTYLGELHPEHDPLGHDHAPGLVEEFSIGHPPGFREAPPGGGFLKLGVGILAKAGSEYAFWESYRLLQLPERTLTLAPDGRALVCRETLASPLGWGYEYAKTVTVVPGEPLLVCTHVLRNTGSRAFQGHHYCHNIIRIDDAPAGPDYEVTFPFAPRAHPHADAPIRLAGKSLHFVRPATAPFYLAFTHFGETAASTGFTVTNRRSGAALSTEIDAPAGRYAFYTEPAAVCPEPFVKIDLAPGQSRQWTQRTRFLA